MLYPNNIEQKLGFDQIREMLAKDCLSPLGQAYVGKMRFSNDFELIKKLMHQTAEFKKILVQEMLFPSQNYIDIGPLLEKIKVEGLFLEMHEFFDFKLFLRTIFKCLDFFNENKDFENLKVLTEGLALDKKILYKID